MGGEERRAPVLNSSAVGRQGQENMCLELRARSSPWPRGNRAALLLICKSTLPGEGEQGPAGLGPRQVVMSALREHGLILPQQHCLEQGTWFLPRADRGRASRWCQKSLPPPRRRSCVGGC